MRPIDRGLDFRSGTMSSPSASSSSSKPSKPPKQTKPPPTQPATNGDANTAPAKGKSAKELKKEKRAALVASRLPAEKGGDQRPNPISSSSANPVPSQPPDPRRAAKPNSDTAIPDLATPQNLFFSHLPIHRPPLTPAALNSTKLHPIIIRLGLLMSSGTLRGANARTMGMMAAFGEVIREYECPDQAVLWKDLPVYLSPMISWLEGCRPKGVAGGNAIRWLKSEINRLGEQGEGGTELEVRFRISRWLKRG